jgi:hypothetical protein
LCGYALRLQALSRHGVVSINVGNQMGSSFSTISIASGWTSRVCR